MQPLQATDPGTVGGFPLLARLGAGGMGQVYLARTPSGRPLAVKTIRADVAAATDFEARFAREIRNSDRVRSPWTVSVVDFSPPGRRPQWLATEYVAAPSLADWVAAHGPLPPDALFALAGELAAALAAVHACDLTHRDLKPSNVLLARERPILIDFGIARATDDSRHTRTGGVIGSPGYLPPEQAVHGAVGAAGDVFSLGAVLAFAASGHGPFEQPGEEVSAASLLYRIVHEPPRLEGLPEALLTVVRRCLAKQPELRPGDEELTALLPRRQGPGGWQRALPPGLADDIAARAARADRLVAGPGADAPPPGFGPVVESRPAVESRPYALPVAPYALPVAPYAPPVAPDAHSPTPRSPRPRAPWIVAAMAVGAAAVLGVVLLNGGSGQADDKGGTTASPKVSAASERLSSAWAGVWTGKGPGNPDADGQLQPRTSSFVVTLTLHAVARGQTAGKQVSNVTEAGTGREVGCTEALELRDLQGSTATFEAITSHPTDRSATSLQCEKGHVYVVQLTDDDTITLGEEGAQTAGAPGELHRTGGSP
ncbi:serine/threonine-protein kinase [Streptomyces sp. 7R007]